MIGTWENLKFMERVTKYWHAVCVLFIVAAIHSACVTSRVADKYGDGTNRPAPFASEHEKTFLQGVFGVRWGISAEEVEQQIPSVTTNPKGFLIARGKLFGYDAEATFRFADGRLKNVVVKFLEEYSSLEDRIASYRDVEELLVDLHGQPVSPTTDIGADGKSNTVFLASEWRIDSLHFFHFLNKSGRRRSKHGMMIQMGKVVAAHPVRPR